MILMESGFKFSFPCDAYPRLAAATHAERSHIELSPMGLHWPDLDEDLSIRGLLRDHAKREPFVGGQAPCGFSISTASLFNAGGATTLTFA